MKIKARAFAGVTALTFTLAGLASPALAQQEIRIGAIVPLSGAATSWGVGLAGAAELAAEDVNAAGGLIIAGKKHKVAVVRFDDKLKASEAVTGINRLVYEDKIKVALTVASVSQLAISQIATDNKVISLTQAFTSKALEKEYPYTFRTAYTSNEFALPQMRWLASKLGAKKVGVLFPNDEGGQQVAADFARAYGAVGITLAKEFFEQGGKDDFAPLLTRLIEQKVDAIDLDGTSPVTAGLIVKQSRELGFKGAIIRTGNESTDDIMKVAGKAASEGLYVHTPANLKDPHVAPYKKRFEDKYKIGMPAGSVLMYASIKVLFAAMQKAGTAEDTAKIVKAYEEMKDVDTIAGKANWVTPRDTAGKEYGFRRQILTDFYIARVRNSELEVAATCTIDGCK